MILLTRRVILGKWRQVIWRIFATDSHRRVHTCQQLRVLTHTRGSTAMLQVDRRWGNEGLKGDSRLVENHTRQLLSIIWKVRVAVLLEDGGSVVGAYSHKLVWGRAHNLHWTGWVCAATGYGLLRGMLGWWEGQGEGVGSGDGCLVEWWGVGGGRQWWRVEMDGGAVSGGNHGGRYHPGTSRPKRSRWKRVYRRREWEEVRVMMPVSQKRLVRYGKVVRFLIIQTV